MDDVECIKWNATSTTSMVVKEMGHSSGRGGGGVGKH